MPKVTKAELLAALLQFIGTTQYHKTGYLSQSTDGAVYLAENAEAYWLLTLIDSVMPKITDDFAILTMKVTEDKQGRRAQVTIDNGYDPKEEKANYKCFHEQVIPFTDFPLDEIKLYIQNRTIMLTSEY